MKLLSIPALALSLMGASVVQAAEVIAETSDTTAGGAVGVLTGVMVGGAAGGPIGALVGAGVGLFAGKGVQEGAGLEGRAYVVRKESGEEDVVRSPNREFAEGEKVVIQGGRLLAPTEAVSSR